MSLLTCEVCHQLTAPAHICLSFLGLGNALCQRCCDYNHCCYNLRALVLKGYVPIISQALAFADDVWADDPAAFASPD